MSAVTVFCPKCQASLKLADRSLLGRTGKCPKCSHRFVLAEPDDVPLELAEPPVSPKAPEPLMGTSARWVPDAPDQGNMAAASFFTIPSEIPDVPELPQIVAPPAPVTKKSAAPAKSSTPPKNSEPAPVPAAPAANRDATTGPATAGAATTGAAKSDDGGSTSARNRRRRRGPNMMVFGSISAVVLGGVIAGVLLAKQMSGTPAVTQSAPARNAGWEQQQKDMATANAAASAVSPTEGEPIPLNYLPFTPHLICHLRPAELWQKDPQFQEFHASLGELSLWMQAKIKEVTTFEPQDIEELTLALNFGPRTTEPELAAVVRLREAHVPTEFNEHFGTNIRTDLDADVFERDPYSYMRIDEKTFAVAPSSMSDSLAAAKSYPALAPPDLDPLLAESDRQRHFTLLFDIKTIDVHRETVFISEMQTVADQFVVWMGKDVETVSWSFHMKPHFFMETLLHQTNDSSVLKVQRFMQGKLDGLPDEMMGLARKMTPETQGERQIVGRFPAMLKAFDTATSVDVGPRYVRLTTLLPLKAAPNLAAGSLLTWSRSVLTDFSKASTVAANDDKAGSALPATVAERLKMPVLVDFRNTPLQEAFEFIGEEIKTTVVIDGDALKAAGFTQNMSQTYNLGSVPALKAIDTILAKYAGERDPMVIVVDEPGKKITVSTKSKAEADGLTIYKTSP